MFDIHGHLFRMAGVEPTGLPASSDRRVQELDLLRALAIAFVLGRHSLFQYGSLPHALQIPLDLWRRGGWVGVDLFFVLSGFLVAGLLFKEYQTYRKIRIGRFLIRRALKIYPAFYLFIACTIPVCVFLRPNVVTSRAVLGEVFFLQNYVGGVWNHTWSLAVEEHFYLVMPLLLWLVSRRATAQPFRAVAAACLAVALICLGLRLFISSHAPHQAEPTSIPSWYETTHTRIDSLMFGVLLACWYHTARERFVSIVSRFRLPLLIIGAAALCLPFVFQEEYTPWLTTYGFSLLYLGSGAWVALAVVVRLPVNAMTKAAAYVGSHSYSIYLWHMPIAWALAILGRRVLHRAVPPIPGLIAYIAAAIGVGIAAAVLVEFPVLRLRDRLFPSRTRTLPTDPG